jgi:heme/copper-type cytochrome/quinol oxidase subunit 2
MEFKDIFFYGVVTVIALFVIVIGIFTFCMKKGRDKNLQS